MEGIGGEGGKGGESSGGVGRTLLRLHVVQERIETEQLLVLNQLVTYASDEHALIDECESGGTAPTGHIRHRIKHRALDTEKRR